MWVFWDSVIEPLLGVTRPRRIVEIGVEAGATTRRLISWARDHEATVDGIDPAPSLDIEQWRTEHGDVLRLHIARSLDALSRVVPPDLALIDGDHNWYTVTGELRALERGAAESSARMPIFLVHDVEWPYGRRDLYYDPDSIPVEHRHAYGRQGLAPNREDVIAGGFNEHLENALHEGGPRNGVATAIEDFVAESTRAWRLHVVPGNHGLGLLVEADRLEEDGRLNDFLGELSSPGFLRRRCVELELERVWARIQVGQLRRAADAARVEVEQLTAAATVPAADPKEFDALTRAVGKERRAARAARATADDLRADLAEAERRASRLERRAQTAEGREDELDALVAELRRQMRASALELEEAAAQRDVAAVRADRAQEALAEVAEAQRTAGEQVTEAKRAADAQVAEAQRTAGAQVAEVQRTADAQIAVARREAADALAGQRSVAAELEHALAGHARLVEELEHAREDLQDRLREAQREAETARKAASELREALGAREIERETLLARAARLEVELGTTRADLEVAEAQRAAAERQIAALTAAEPPPAAAEPRPEVRDPEPALVVSWTPTELEAQARLRTEYVDGAALTQDGRDKAALPSARDRRGVLLGAAQAHPDGRPRVDVIVCVHDALEDVRRCLWSLVEKTTYPFHLTVVDDGSGVETARYLDGVAATAQQITLIRNANPPHGYTIAANLGLRAARGDYLVLLNSDTIVTPQWLERIVAAGEAEPGVGILGPLSNAASHQSVPELRSGGAWATNPLPAHLPTDGLALLLDRVSPRRRPRIPFINGFCYVIKRAVLETVGYLDEEHFASGYCEENDLSHRAALAGFDLAVVDDAYVYHAKSKSFSVEGRKVLARRNYEIFLDKHGRDVINAKVAAMEANTELAPLRAMVGDALSSTGALAAALDLPDHAPLRVVFVLPGLGDGGSGGSHSIYQEVRGLRQLGVPARIALSEHAWPRALKAYDDAHDVFETFRDIDELAQRTQDADVISATHFKSVALVAALREHREDFLPAYYIQDYEPFFTSRDAADIDEAIRSYTLIDDCLLFAKTHWLCNIVAERHGRYVAKVEPSIDERLFVGSEREGLDRPLRVIAMVRPRTPRRQPSATVAVLEELARVLGDRVEVGTFGCPRRDLEALGASARLLHGHRGLLSRAQVAELLSSADVFVDLSTYQAFGRTALEAMACGCTAVVPRLGGVWEFVEDGVNAVAVDTLEPDTALEAVLSLARDREAVLRMQRAARETAGRYSVMRAALSEYLAFEREHRHATRRWVRSAGIDASRA
jgi:GT2 family glycosyltransferase/glycosyltransferase involved in cell wall biosynthesis